MTGPPADGISISVVGDGAGVATLTIDSSGSGEMDSEAAHSLAQALRGLTGDRNKAVLILTGTDGRFCGPVAQGAVPAFFGALEAIQALRLPVIAAVNGTARGLGASLAAAADIVLAAEGAVFCLDGLTTGALPPSRTLRRLVPPRLLRYLVLSGAEIGAARLYALGGIDEIVPRAALMDRTHALATSLAAKSPTLIRLMKEAMGVIEELPLPLGQKIEALYTTLATGTDDAREAAVAFLEKRPPVWRKAQD